MASPQEDTLANTVGDQVRFALGGNQGAAAYDYTDPVSFSDATAWVGTWQIYSGIPLHAGGVALSVLTNRFGMAPDIDGSQDWLVIGGWIEY